MDKVYTNPRMQSVPYVILPETQFDWLFLISSDSFQTLLNHKNAFNLIQIDIQMNSYWNYLTLSNCVQSD